MAKRRYSRKRSKKVQLPKWLSLVIGLAILIGGGFQTYQSTYSTNRVITQNQSKQKLVPKNVGSVADNKLAQMDYAGTAIIQVNGGKPDFSKSDLSTSHSEWATYTNLDALGRVGQANAMLGVSLLPKEPRERLYTRPTGWSSVRLNNQNVYNRSHLIAFSLAGEQDNPKNLMTGTRQLNDPGMAYYESRVLRYIRETSHHVRYQVTPIFRSNELVARGVHMQAASVEDNAVSFNIYIFNVEPGTSINYQTGYVTIN